MTINIDWDLNLADCDCDFCSFNDEYEADNFQEAVDEMKTDGWEIFKEEDEWMHRCPVCVEKLREENKLNNSSKSFGGLKIRDDKDAKAIKN